MKHGEIVRTPGGSIERANVLSAHPLDFPEESLKVVTVAELFDAAGHPVPEGYIVFLHGAVWMCFTPHRFGIFQCNDRNVGWEFDLVRGNDQSWPDLSRLPALDAWSALPEVIKAAVT